jgi:hypothetical protein
MTEQVSKKKENKMNDKTTKTATETYNEFITENGSDVSKLTPALQATYSKLLAAKVREDKKKAKPVGKREIKISEESVVYKSLAEKNSIPVSDKFAGFVEVAKTGPKDKETGKADTVQYIIGVKAKIDGKLWNITANVSPKEISDDVIEATKVAAIRVLGAANKPTPTFRKK